MLPVNSETNYGAVTVPPGIPPTLAIFWFGEIKFVHTVPQTGLWTGTGTNIEKHLVRLFPHFFALYLAML
jgi:hypothetical protein